MIKSKLIPYVRNVELSAKFREAIDIFNEELIIVLNYLPMQYFNLKI